MPNIREHRNARMSRLQAQAAAQMAGFSFRNLSSHTEGREVCELWRCQKPGTAIWSFDIAVSSRGVVVFGDIDGLIFRAPSGLSLLAHHDLDYVISKLEAQCRDAVFDQEAFLDICLDAAQERVNSVFSDVDDDALRIKSDELCGTEAVAHARRALAGLAERSGLDGRQIAWCTRLSDFLSDALIASNFESEAAARAFFEENRKLVGVESWEYGLTQPSESLLIRLASVRIAASAILDLQRVDDVQNETPGAVNSTARGIDTLKAWLTSRSAQAALPNGSFETRPLAAEEVDAARCLRQVRQSGRSVRYLIEMQRSPEVCLAAVQQDGTAIEYLTKEQRTMEVRRAAVRQAGYAIRFFSAEQLTPELCLAAVEQDGWAIQQIPPEHRSPDMCLAAVRRAGRAIQHLHPGQRTPELCLAAIQQDNSSIRLLAVDILDAPGAEPLAQWLAAKWATVSAALGDKAPAWAEKLIEVLEPAETEPMAERQRA